MCASFSYSDPMAEEAPKEKKLTKKELRILERQRAAVRRWFAFSIGLVRWTEI